MDKEQALERIKKCLRLSKSDNEHEAAQALKHAQALMRQFGISSLDIELAEVTEAGVRAPVNTPRWHLSLFNICRRAFGVDGYINTDYRYSGSGYSKKVHFQFFGIAPKPELARYAFEILLRQLKIARREYMKTELQRVRLAKNKKYRADEFCEGWASAVMGKVENFAMSAEEKRKLLAYETNKLDLVVNERKRKPPKVLVYGERDYFAGREKGREAQLHHAMHGAEADQLKRLNFSDIN